MIHQVRPNTPDEFPSPAECCRVALFSNSRVDSIVEAHSITTLPNTSKAFLGHLVDAGDTLSFAGPGVDDDVTRNGVCAQGKPACFGRGRKRRAGAAEVRISRAAAIAVTAVVTRRAAVVPLSQYRRSPDGDLAIAPPALDGSLEKLFAAGHLHRRKKLSVGKIWNVLVRAADADELFDLVIVRRELGVGNRPVVAVAVSARGFEFIIRQAIALASPGDRATSDLAAANPIERLFVSGVGVRIIDVVDKELEWPYALHA